MMATEDEWEGQHGGWVWTSGEADGRAMRCAWCQGRVTVGRRIVVARKRGFGPLHTVHEAVCWRPWHASYVLGEEYATLVVLVRLGGDEGPSLDEVLDEHPDVVLHGMVQHGVGPDALDLADRGRIEVEGVAKR